MRNQIIAATAVVLLSGAMATWAGQGGRGQHERGGGGGIAWLLNDQEALKKLGVTDEQQTALKTASYEFRKEMAKLNADRELADLDVRKAMDEDKPVESDVMKAVEKAGAAETALRKAQTKYQLQIKSILGADKLSELKSMQQERRMERRGDKDDKKGGQFKASPKFMNMQDAGRCGAEDTPPPEDVE